jgi:hypothetical protein
VRPRVFATGQHALFPKLRPPGERPISLVAEPVFDPLSPAELGAFLERELSRPPLLDPEDLERIRQRSRALLRKAEEHLRRSPIGRGDL